MSAETELFEAVAGYVAVSQKVVATLLELKYNDDEPHDDHGRWGSGGGSGSTLAKQDVAAWLADSKNKVVTYHVTDAAGAQSLLKNGVSSKMGMGALGPGFYTSSKSGSESLSHAAGHEVQVAVKLERPLIGTSTQIQRYYNKMLAASQKDPHGSPETLRQAMLKDYDGFIVRNVSWANNADWVIAFKPEAVKFVDSSKSVELKYSDNEPRDDHGRWDSGGGGSTVPDREGHPIRPGMDVYDAESGERGHVVSVRPDANGRHLALVHLPHFTNAASPTGHHIVLSQSLSSTEHGIYHGLGSFAAMALAHQAAQAEYGPHGRAWQKDAKGDVGGHEFHGNRYTGGIGGTAPGTGLRPEIAARAAHVMDQILKAEAAGKCTNMPPNEHDPNAPGRYSAARQAQHDAIINTILDENKDVPVEHKAWIMGGLGGAGKTTLLSAGAPGTKNEGNPITMPDGTTQTAAQVFGIEAVPGTGRGGGSTPVLSNAVNVNADDITERMAAAGMLPEVDHLAPMEMSYLAHEEASTISHELADRVIARGQNMIWDVTLGSRTSGLDRISQLKEAGYKVTGVFVDVSVDHSISAALTRYQRGVDDYANGVGLGGRYVPPSLIEQGRDGSEAYSKNRLAFDSLVAAGAFDKSVVIDNEKGARRVVKIG